MGNDRLRQLRESHGWTQAELAEMVCDHVEQATGHRPGLNAAMISNYENGRGGYPRRHTLDALCSMFSVTAASDLGFQRKQAASSAVAVAVPTGEESPVRRRDFLQSAAALSVEAALYRPSGATRPEDVLRHELARAQRDFRESRYSLLGQRLPALLEHAQAGDNPIIATAAYNLATEYLIKINADDLTLVTTDRARRAAEASGDPAAKADAAWCLCVSLRHSGRSQTGHTIVQDAADQLDMSGLNTDNDLALYGHLFLTAAYTAAAAGNAGLARDYMSEAQQVASRFENEYAHGMWFFGPAQTALYGLSTAMRLGDTGMALQHARNVTTEALPTPERRARYWIDLARVYAQNDDRENTRMALQHVYTEAPEEANRRRFIKLANQVGYALPAGGN